MHNRADLPPTTPVNTHRCSSICQYYCEWRTTMTKKSVGFLKSHKCASSSVQNILMRWGVKQEMNFVLPSSGNYMRSETQLKYSRDMLAGTEWEKKGLEYHIFCLYTVWNTQVWLAERLAGITYFSYRRCRELFLGQTQC